MALEEMLVCEITHGYLYYGETRRRERVEFTLELRKREESLAKEMKGYAQRGYTPQREAAKALQRLFFKRHLSPPAVPSPSVREYIEQRMEELAQSANRKRSANS